MVDRSQLADDDSTNTQQRRRLTWKLRAGGLLVLGLLVVLLLACVLWIPRWLYPSLTETDLRGVSDAAKVQELRGARLKLQNDARTTLVQGLGAVLVLTGAGIGASVTLRQIRETATANRNQLQLGEQGQVTDRFTKAIDQLDNKQALAVRLGGLYALERIAHDSPADRTTIAEVLCAYARTAPRPKPLARRAKDANRPIADDAPAETPAAYSASLAERAPDVQAAVTILGRWWRRLGGPPPVLDLHNADLQGAILATQIEGTILVPPHDEAHRQGVALLGAELQRTNLEDAELLHADLRGAQLQDASLRYARLQGANLEGARLERADLRGAQLQDASLEGADLEDARASEATCWPEGWDHARLAVAGVRFVDHSASLTSDEVDIRSPDEPVPPGEKRR
jgi:hypothetical protein